MGEIVAVAIVAMVMAMAGLVLFLPERHERPTRADLGISLLAGVLTGAGVSLFLFVVQLHLDSRLQTVQRQEMQTTKQVKEVQDQLAKTTQKLSLVVTLTSQRRLVGIDLHGDDLTRFYLSGKDLMDANLSGAVLTEASLAGANLQGADLQGAHLSDADLHYANLRGAYLIGADLTYSDLQGANLARASLEGAQLAGALYDLKTKWPPNFSPEQAGAQLVGSGVIRLVVLQRERLRSREAATL